MLVTLRMMGLVETRSSYGDSFLVMYLLQLDKTRQRLNVNPAIWMGALDRFGTQRIFQTRSDVYR